MLCYRTPAYMAASQEDCIVVYMLTEMYSDDAAQHSMSGNMFAFIQRI